MEMWDLYTIEGKKTGRSIARKDMLNIPDGQYHLVAEVWVLDGDALLLTQRHPGKSHPLQWACAGGAVLAGETSVAGALRELKEETGLILKEEDLQFMGQDIYEKKHYLCDVYLAEASVSLQQLILQPDEVVEARKVTYGELEKLLAEGVVSCSADRRLHRWILPAWRKRRQENQSPSS